MRLSGRVAWLVVLSALSGCVPLGPVGPPAMVGGPEATDLAGMVTGDLVTERPVGGIVSISLPSGKESVVRPTTDSTTDSARAACAVGGPDAAGRIVAIDQRLNARYHELTVGSLAGGPTKVIFNRPGDALWDHVVGESLSLSPTGGNVALLSTLKGAQMRNPSALLEEGTLESWNIDRLEGGPLPVMALDAGLAWFPDGRRLAYVALVPVGELTRPPRLTDDFGSEFAGWDRVPVVHICDMASGQTRRVHVGWHPAVSSHGDAMLISDYRYRTCRVNLESGDSTLVRVPGQFAGPIALLDGGLILYMGLPTTGSKREFTRYYSPISGRKAMRTIKVAEMSTGRFQTLVPYIDPRSRPSYGHVSH